MTKSCITCSAACATGPKVLECRALPPTSTPIVAPNQLGQPSVIAKIASYPIVQPDWWCRTWEPAEVDQTIPKPADGLLMGGGKLVRRSTLS